MKDKKPMALFFGVMVIFNMAASFAHPVTPQLIVERGLDSSMFGVALAAMMTVNFLVSPFWGKMCNYIPAKRIMFICGIGYAVGQMIFGAAYSEVQVVLGRMFAGIFTGGMFTSLMNYIIAISEPDKRGQNLTVLATSQAVFGAVGYFIGGMLGLISTEAAFMAQVVILAVCGGLFYLVCDDESMFVPKQKRTGSLIKEANPFVAFMASREFMTATLALLFAIVAFASIGQNAFEQCFNYYIKDQFGLSSAYNGGIKAAIAVISLLANSTICIWLIRKTDIHKTFLPVLACCTLALGSILLVNNMIPFFVINVIFFAFNAVRLPLMQNMTASMAVGANSNVIMGFYNSMNSLGGIIGALFAGLMYATNPRLPFMFAFAAFAVATAIGFVYLGKHKAAAETAEN